MIAATAALSIIILIIIILLILIIVILVIKVLPGYRRRGRRGDETPSYASSAHDYPMQNKPPKQPKQSPPPSNGGLPKEDPEQIPPYPSVLPPGRQDADEMDSPASSQARPGASNSDLKDIPDDLQLTDDDEDDNADDCDTLMKKEDFNRPQSYDKLPSKDSAV